TRPVRRVEVNALENGGSELIGALVFGGTAGVATSSPAALAFGAVAVGSTAQAQVALTNQGQLPLQLGDAQPPAAGFALVEDACSATTLAPAQQCLPSYGFTPDYPGAFEAVAVLPDGATLPLSGVGVQAWLATAPGYVQFPPVAVGEDATTGLALRNPGTAVQVVTGLASSSAAFSTAPGSCGELPVALQPGQECVLEVVFAPQ